MSDKFAMWFKRNSYQKSFLIQIETKSPILVKMGNISENRQWNVEFRWDFGKYCLKFDQRKKLLNIAISHHHHRKPCQKLLVFNTWIKILSSKTAERLRFCIIWDGLPVVPYKHSKTIFTSVLFNYPVDRNAQGILKGNFSA